jgi:hypothetical protein
MRPLFAINLAAGLTFGFALLYTLAGAYGAFITSRALKSGPEVMEVERLKRDADDFFGGAVRSGCVAILLVPILVYARKLKRQA